MHDKVAFALQQGSLKYKKKNKRESLRYDYKIITLLINL